VLPTDVITAAFVAFVVVLAASAKAFAVSAGVLAVLIRLQQSKIEKTPASRKFPLSFDTT
jgi:hypothetical protein